MRVLLIAPDPLARLALADLLEQADCAVVGRSAGDREWSDDIAVYRPDLIVCDLGWQAAPELPDLRELEMPTVALAGNSEAAALAWSAGARGVLGRAVLGQGAQSAETMRAAVQAVAAGLVVFDPVIWPDGPFAAATNDGATEAAPPLTPRELDVLQLLAEGLTNRGIAHRLQISDNTVKFHVNAVLTKLGAQSRTDAVVRAARLGWLTL